MQTYWSVTCSAACFRKASVSSDVHVLCGARGTDLEGADLVLMQPDAAGEEVIAQQDSADRTPRQHREGEAEPRASIGPDPFSLATDAAGGAQTFHVSLPDRRASCC